MLHVFETGGELEGKKQFRRPRHRWEGNIKMGLREVGWKGMDWIDMVQFMDRWRTLLNAVLNLRVP
jgi:hypothetical protein